VAFDTSQKVGCVNCCSDVDDVVLQYMVSILEELGNSAALEDLFDVEQFTEMMEAYLPGFQAVDRFAVIICVAYVIGLTVIKFVK